MKSAKALATLSRHTCADMGQIIGPTDDVLDKIFQRSLTARKPFHVNIRGLDDTDHFTSDIENYVAKPGGQLQKILPELDTAD